MKSFRALSVLLFALLGAPVVRSQVMDNTAHVDTLTLAERLSLRTNVVDWALLTPNVGVEFDLRSTNWSRWAVGLNLRYNWNTRHTFVPGKVYNVAEVRAEVRNYWRTRDLSSMASRSLRPHKWWIDKAVSQRRKTSRHPVTTFYRGFYASYTDYSLLLGREGKQGSMVQAGVLYGVMRPLYQFHNGNSVDLDFGISAGLAYTKYDKYRHDRENNCYPVTGHKDWHLVKHPVVADVRVGVVYRFGNYPINKKYRFRYDVDQAYQARIDSINELRRRRRMEKLWRDSVYNMVFNEFEHLYDSISRDMVYRKDSVSFANRGMDNLRAREAKALERENRREEQQQNRTQHKADRHTLAAERRADRERRKVERRQNKEAEARQRAVRKQEREEKQAAERRRAEERKAAAQARKTEAREAAKARRELDRQEEQARRERAREMEQNIQKDKQKMREGQQ